MPTNTDIQTEKRSGKKSRLHASEADPSAARGGPPAAEPAAKHLPAPRTNRLAAPLRPSRREVTRRIRDAAERSMSWPARDRLRRLADSVAAGAGDPQRAQFVEAAIVESLDEATTKDDGERWLNCEAATWALGWLARSTRAGGSAGGLLERLVQQATAATPLLEQGETLPATFVFTLARLFSDVEACRRFEAVATAAVVAEIERLVSVCGTVCVAGSGEMVERVVRWCRFREVAHRTGEPAWEAVTDRRWREAATNAVRLLGQRGRRITSAGLLPARFTEPLLDAVEMLGRKRKRTVQAVLRPRTDAGKPRRFIRRDLHDAAAAVAVIRSGWDAAAIRVLIDYRQPMPHLEIAAGDRLLVDGPWQWTLTDSGRPLEAEGPWSVSCWESDQNAAFLEITTPLPGGRQFERHLVMLRRERILLLADAVTTPGAGITPAAPAGANRTNGEGANGANSPLGLLRYSATVPLAAGLETELAAETREILAFDTAMRLMALPLGLPEWRTAGRGGFTASPDGLSIVQETLGRRLYAPLWLDFDSARVGQPLTWRQLTVADTRILLPPHQAAGFRVQSGLEQWLLYRTLDAARNRTLLGCNVSCEFLLGRVRPDGTVRRTLEIQ